MLPVLAGHIGPPCVLQEGKNVKVTVVAILASTQSTEVDPALKCIAAEVRKKNPRFTGFKMGVTTRQSLKVGEQGTFELVDNQSVKVTILPGSDAHNWVKLRVIPPSLAEIEYQTICGKFFPMCTRYQTKQGQRLLFAICVQPCHGKKK
jgi:hypothetical protein